MHAFRSQHPASCAHLGKLPKHVLNRLTRAFDQASKCSACTQVYLHSNGSVSDFVFELSCPAAGDAAGLLPVFVAQMPAQESQPGQAHTKVPLSEGQT